MFRFGSWDYIGAIPIFPMTSDHFEISDAMNFLRSSGPRSVGSAPCSAKSARTFGSFVASCAAAYKLIDERLVHVGGRKQRKPGIALVTLQAGFGSRRHIGQRRHTFVAGHRKGTRIAVPYQAQNVRQQLKSDGNLAGDEVGRIARQYSCRGRGQVAFR